MLGVATVLLAAVYMLGSGTMGTAAQGVDRPSFRSTLATLPGTAHCPRATACLVCTPDTAKTSSQWLVQTLHTNTRGCAWSQVQQLCLSLPALPLATVPGRRAPPPPKAPGFKPKDSKSKATEEEVEELLAQVGRDLEPWKQSGITLEMVEKAYCTEEIFESMRIQVRGQHENSIAGWWV